MTTAEFSSTQHFPPSFVTDLNAMPFPSSLSFLSFIITSLDWLGGRGRWGSSTADRKRGVAFYQTEQGSGVMGWMDGWVGGWRAERNGSASLLFFALFFSPFPVLSSL